MHACLRPNRCLRCNTHSTVACVLLLCCAVVARYSLCALRADRRRIECLPFRRHPQVLDEPVASGVTGLLEKRCVGIEVPAVISEQLLGLRSGLVHLALDFSKG